MSDYPNIPMGEDEPVSDDDKLYNYYSKSGVDVYLEQEKELERKRENTSDRIAKENTEAMQPWIFWIVAVAVFYFCLFWAVRIF